MTDAGTPRAKAARYDRKLDPREQQPFDIAWDSPEGVRLSTKLELMRAQLRDLRTALAPLAVETQQIGEAAEDRLRELGYSGTPSLPTIDQSKDLPLCMDGCIWAN